MKKNELEINELSENNISKKNEKKWLGFQKKNRIDRINMLEKNNFLNKEFKEILENNENLSLNIAEQLTENNVGTFALPFSIAPNFLINDVPYAVPMVTEEPSVVAACSYAAKIIEKSGGFKATVLDRKMIGQVALYDILDVEIATKKILENKSKLLQIANDSHPSIVLRGGGAIDIEVKSIFENDTTFLIVYLIADVKEAMGANILNNMLEGIKPILEEISCGKALMAILSNYATKSLVTATCEIDIRLLSTEREKCIEIAKKIELASKFSKMDIYRATTHNKGIFNGIDAVVIATGNDFRAIEAGGHAFATKNGRYEGLTTWTFNGKKLIGELTLPMPIASVGGSIGLNPTVKVAFNILKNPNAKTLSQIVVCVGLAQNFAAIKALVTTGIQSGHMKLQAKSLALFAGANENQVEVVVEKLIKEKFMNLETAKKILKEILEN